MTGHGESLPPLESAYADSGSLRIHYMRGGSGRPLLFLHGFPDFWYGWRFQLAALAGDYRVLAMDLRGYNLSDAPGGQKQYRMEHLIADVLSVLAAERLDQAVVIGHDWGGAIAWRVAMHSPAAVRGLAVLATPHPLALARELRESEAQRAASEYASRLRAPGSEERLTTERLASLVARSNAELQHYIEAFERSDIAAMMHYYRANYPRAGETAPELPAVACPTLLIAGLDDGAFLPDCFNGTWRWIDAEFQLVTLPGVRHSPHIDEPDRVNRILADWLGRLD